MYIPYHAWLSYTFKEISLSLNNLKLTEKSLNLPSLHPELEELRQLSLTKRKIIM